MNDNDLTELRQIIIDAISFVQLVVRVTGQKSANSI